MEPLKDVSRFLGYNNSHCSLSTREQHTKDNIPFLLSPFQGLSAAKGPFLGRFNKGECTSVLKLKSNFSPNINPHCNLVIVGLGAS